MEVEASVDEEDIKENININPFASRHGKTLSWRGVNMAVVSFVFFPFQLLVILASLTDVPVLNHNFVFHIVRPSMAV